MNKFRAFSCMKTSFDEDLKQKATSTVTSKKVAHSVESGMPNLSIIWLKNRFKPNMWGIK